MDAGFTWSGGKTKSDDGWSGSADAAEVRASRARLARALQSLGPLLCLYPAHYALPLSGWLGWRRVTPTIDIDSDGPWEGLAFIDGHGDVCWQLGLLPDADFYAWECLLDTLPGLGPDFPPMRADRPRRKPCVDWHACALRLFDCGGGELAANVPALSPAGMKMAARIATLRRARLDGA